MYMFIPAVAVGTVTETPENNTTKTSRAEIVLKSATLPRRKAAKAEIQLDTTPKVLYMITTNHNSTEIVY